MSAQLRIGVIKEVLADKDRCIVHFSEDDDLDSCELCVLHCNSLKNRHYHLPDANEQVYVLTDENGEEGVILGAIYSEADPPPLSDTDKYYMDFEDGTALEYDRKEHKLKLKVSSSGTIEIECEGNVSVRSDRALSLTAAQKIALTAPEIALNTAALTCSDPDAPSGIGSAVLKSNLDIKGQTFKLNSSSASLTAVQAALNGPLSVTGAVNVIGNISATGSIMDAGGNSNHHAHF
ncbi:MAG: phage baseplate assembly protein V [Synergistaceae bacterium]|nr:phage baseplate assembly protein V [Synergistaceae bacterium]MBQ6909648.1 phage baseplate assembly protein V [Synergistaceae bacterium]